MISRAEKRTEANGEPTRSNILLQSTRLGRIAQATQLNLPATRKVCIVTTLCTELVVTKLRPLLEHSQNIAPVSFFI